MYQKLNTKIYEWATINNPFTNVYGLARSLIALSTLIVLLFNDTTTFFRPMAGISEYPACSAYSISLFCLFPADYLPMVRWAAIILLAIIASGYRPRFTGIIHWWIASSLQNTAGTLDGGEQVATALTFLLIPITLLDNRKWHWEQPSFKDFHNKFRIHANITSLIFLYAIRFQMALIYFQAGIGKLKNPEWIDGTAVYYYFNDPMLGFNEVLLSLFNPILTSPLVFFITWGTIGLEILLGGAILAVQKKNNVFMYLGFSLHIAIALMLGLYSFTMIMCAGLILAFRPVRCPFKLKTDKAETSENEMPIAN